MKLRLAATLAVCAALVTGSEVLNAQVGPGNQVQQNQIPQGPIPQQGPSGPQPGGPAPQQFGPQPPPPPFTLDPQQQADLDQVLATWEKQSGQLKTFKCNFVHWVYDATFVPPDNANGERARSIGELNYEAPDKGMFREDEVTTWQFNPTSRKLEPVKLKHGEHWACDGKSITQVDYVKQEVHETNLPPEMQGQSITEGPLPFAFGAQAAKLKARYYIRVSTPKDAVGEVWLDIFPKLQKDVVNFIEVEVILNAGDMLPLAIRIRRNRNDSEVYKFVKQSFMTRLIQPFAWDVFKPRPFGFKLIAEKAPGEGGPPAGNIQPPGGQPPSGNNNQARRPNGPNGAFEH